MGFKKKQEIKKRFLELWQRDKKLFFLENKEIVNFEGEPLKLITSLQFVWIWYNHIDADKTSNSNYGDIDRFYFIFNDLDNTQPNRLYISSRANSACNTILVYLLSNDIDLMKPLSLEINPEKKTLKVIQEDNKISWAYNPEEIKEMRRSLWDVGFSLKLFKELAEKIKNKYEVNIYFNKKLSSLKEIE